MDHHIIGMVFHAPALVPAQLPSLYHCMHMKNSHFDFTPSDRLCIVECGSAVTAAGDVDVDVDVDDDRTKKMNNKKTRSI